MDYYREFKRIPKQAYLVNLRKNKMIDSVGAAPGKIPVQQTTSTRFTSGFEMGPGGTTPVWPSIKCIPIEKEL